MTDLQNRDHYPPSPAGPNNATTYTASTEWYGTDALDQPLPPARPAGTSTPLFASSGTVTGPGEYTPPVVALRTGLQRIPRKVLAAFAAALVCIAVFFGGFAIGHHTAAPTNNPQFGQFAPGNQPGFGPRNGGALRDPGTGTGAGTGTGGSTT